MREFSYGDRLLFYIDIRSVYLPQYVGYADRFEVLNSEEFPNGLKLDSKSGEISGETITSFTKIIIIVAYNNDKYETNTTINIISRISSNK